MKKSIFLSLAFLFWITSLCLIGGKEEDSSANEKEEYTVTFDTNGGNAVVSRTVNKDEKVTQPTDPARDSFAFDGWYTDEATTLAYDFTTPVTANLIFYVKWTVDVSSDIVFASLTDAAKTLIGMREFLLTVTYNGFANGVKDSLVFIHRGVDYRSHLERGIRYLNRSVLMVRQI